jgi:hypothetical protein
MFVLPEKFSENVRKNKVVLRELIALLTTEIQSRSPSGREFDFRFVLPLAQWMCEQGGYNTAPLGNNPGNVDGKGDAGSVFRENRTERKKGVVVNYPKAPFAAYSSMTVATKAKFDHLLSNWFNAYLSVLYGGSVESYVSGLYPGKGRDYATAEQTDYLPGMRFRMGQLLEHLRLSLEDDRKELEAQVPLFPVARGAARPVFELTDHSVKNLKARAAIGAELAALSEVESRFREGRGVPV